MSQTQQPQPTGGQEEFFEELVESGVDEEVASSIQALLSKDFVLGNVRRADREYLRYHVENIIMMAVEEFPPAESRVQGAAGAALLGDPSYRKEGMSQAQKNRNEAIALDNFWRASRSQDGWQQDKIVEQRQVQEVEDRRGDEAGGIMDKIF